MALGRDSRNVLGSLHELSLQVASRARAAYEDFSSDRAELAAAALTFYALLSLAPLIVIAVALAGVFINNGAAQESVSQVITETMGDGATETVLGWAAQARENSGVASVVGTLLTLVAASRFTESLRESLNQVWNIEVSRADGFFGTIRLFLQRRLFALALVLASGPLVILVFISRTSLSWIEQQLGVGEFAGAVISFAYSVLSIVSIAGLCSLAYRFIPDDRAPWWACLQGATLTALLFSGGNYLVSIYLQRAGESATYGVAGSLVVVLLWLYYSAQMFLFGAEFAQVTQRGLEARETTRGNLSAPSGPRIGENEAQLPLPLSLPTQRRERSESV